MDKEKIIKSISLSKLKILEPTEETKERRVRFVASTAKEDRDYEIVQIDTFRLPLKGGGHIKVSDLPTGGSENVDIPFLTNHDLWSVEKTIGSVRKAMYENGQLIFEAGISGREYAQDVFKLIEEGHLDNAFSIQFRDYDWNMDTDTLTNGEIIEVSLVTRGSNTDAQVLEVKAVKGAEMNSEEKSVDTKATEPEKSAEETTENKTEETNTEVNEDKSTTQEEKDKTMNDNDLGAKATADATTQAKIANEDAEKGFAKPSQEVASVKFANGDDYLKSKQAEHDFAQTIVKNYGQPRQAVMKAWADVARSKGVTGDSILPTYIEQLFFKAWEDHYEQLGTFRRTNLLAGSIYAMNTADRGLGHKKGDKKAEQDVSDVRRDYKAKIVYKKLSIDLQDLLDDQTGELLRFRAEELATRTDDEIVRAVVFGDGRTQPTTAGDPDYRIFDGVRGPWSMKNDLDNVATSGSFSAAVATVVANDTADNAYTSAVKTLGAVRGGAGRKILVAPEGFMQSLLLTTKANGDLLFAPGTNMQDILGAYIFESPYMAGSGYDLIAYREGSYLLAMGDVMIRTMFDLNFNTDVMLHERAVGGSIFGHKTLAGYASKA